MDNKENIAKCSHRINGVSNKLARDAKIIGSLNREDLIKRLELTTDIRNMWKDFDTVQLKHLNIISLSQSISHDMSIVLCKCAKDLEISIPDDIESPDQFHKYVLGQIRSKRQE